MRTHRIVPPGLRELAEEENMTDYQIGRLLEAASTIRGKYPDSVDEWRTLWNVCKEYLTDD